MNTRPNYQRGTTLVELLVSIVIVAIAASTVLGLLSMTTANSADPMIRHQAAAIAEAYLEEILLKPLADPDGADGESNRADYDDLDDYDGLSDAGARNQFGNALAGLDSYNVAVSVVPTASLPSTPLADAVRIDVVVSHSNDVNFVLSAYRTRF